MLSEGKRIKTKAQLKEYLDVELEPYQLHGRQYIAYIFQISERAILRRHTILLRKTEYHLNAGHKLIGELYYARLMKFQLKYSIHIPINCFGKGLRVMQVGPCTMNGEITVDEIPALWNQKYQDYLGVAVPDDAQGCLQDVHWTMPAGYFPSYALGSAYGVQILRTMEKDFDVFACAARGDLLPIRDWLKEHVFSIASVTTPDEWLRAITGESLNPDYFLTYLEEKFSALYALA